MCAYPRGKRFSENLALCFLETPVLRFALLPYYQRIPKGFLKVPKGSHESLFPDKSNSWNS